MSQLLSAVNRLKRWQNASSDFTSTSAITIFSSLFHSPTFVIFVCIQIDTESHLRHLCLSFGG